MIGFGSGLEENHELITKMKKLRWFKISYPKGGHYNDGYELYLTLNYDSAESLISDLGVFGIEYLILESADRGDNQDYRTGLCEYRLNGKTVVVSYSKFQKVLNYSAYISIGSDYLSINLNQSSWYYVTLDDINAATEVERQILPKSKSINL